MDLLLDTDIVVLLVDDELDLLPTRLQPAMLDPGEARFVSTASL